jgi:chromate transport protein ChrA
MVIEILKVVGPGALILIGLMFALSSEHRYGTSTRLVGFGAALVGWRIMGAAIANGREAIERSAEAALIAGTVFVILGFVAGMRPRGGLRY